MTVLGIGILIGSIISSVISSNIIANKSWERVRNNSEMLEYNHIDNALLETSLAILYLNSIRRGDEENLYSLICYRLENNRYLIERAHAERESSSTVYQSLQESLKWLNEHGHCENNY